MNRGAIINTLCLAILLFPLVWPLIYSLRSPTGWFADYLEAAKLAANPDDGDYSFAIEFGLDGVTSSVGLRNGSTYGLANVVGDTDYQNLMQQYLERCHEVYLTQTPPTNSAELLEAWKQASMEGFKQESFVLRSPDSYWKDWFEVVYMNKPRYSRDAYETLQFADDIGVKVLAQAVEDLKIATKREMSRQLNVTGNFTWAHATIVAPDFFWTTIDPYRFKPNPEPEDPVETYNGGAWHENLYSFSLRGSAFWLFHMQQKFQIALNRNKFRLDDIPGEHLLFRGDSLRQVYGMTPTSHNTLSHTRRYHCSSPEEVNSPDSLACSPGSLSPANIAITLINASLSLCPGKLKIAPPLWSTFPELGGHKLKSCGDDTDCATHHLDMIIEKFNTFVQAVNSTDGTAVDLVFAGDSWTKSSLEMFSERLRTSHINNKISISNEIHQPDTYAATQRAARWGMHYLKQYHPYTGCPGVPSDPDYYDEEYWPFIAHDEL